MATRLIVFTFRVRTSFRDPIAHGENQRGAFSRTVSSSLQLIRATQKLNVLRLEADAAVDRAEAAEAKNKKLELELLARDQDITSLQHKLSLMDADLEKAEAKLADAKHAHEEGDSARSTAENLQRKIQILEEELDNAEKNLKETVEKFVS